LYRRPGSRVKTTRKLSRLKKPDNEKRISEASKEAEPKRTEGKRTKELEKDINSKESTVRTLILASNRGLSR
jgi:hypothetical protein